MISKSKLDTYSLKIFFYILIENPNHPGLVHYPIKIHKKRNCIFSLLLSTKWIISVAMHILGWKKPLTQIKTKLQLPTNIPKYFCCITRLVPSAKSSTNVDEKTRKNWKIRMLSYKHFNFKSLGAIFPISWFLLYADNANI